MTEIRSLTKLRLDRFETPALLKKVASASRQLAEFKGVGASIPNQGILINTLGLQEAKDSSAIENIITTHDELFRDAAFPDAGGSAAAKEVMRYREALHTGFELVRKDRFISANHIIRIQKELEKNEAGFRKLPGTTLKDPAGKVVYTPPQEHQAIVELMTDLERFINDPDLFPADPLIRMALLHHQFESIHPFYDGNGRTGRIVNVLFLVLNGLLDIPILYMSRHIVRTKTDYYRLLQSVRDLDTWEEWVAYILTAVEETARQGIATVEAIKDALLDLKHRIRKDYKFYSQDLINNLFSFPYTKIQFIMNDLDVSRLTATRYLDALADGGFLVKQRIGRTNYYVNARLVKILSGEAMTAGEPAA